MTKTRTYIRIIPTNDTIYKINCVLGEAKLPIRDFADDPHSTIIYSKDIVEVDTIKLPEIKSKFFGIYFTCFIKQISYNLANF